MGFLNFGGPYFIMRYIVYLILTVATFNVMAQKAPPWVDYANRALLYPDSKFLVGLATEIRIEKFQAGSAFERLNQLSRNQIIETIHISIKAESQLNISVENTNTNELYELSSKSVSKAELVGLKVENYYNKKKKTAFSFSYVLIQDLIDYYFDVLQTNFDIIEKDFSGVENSSNKNTALKLLFDAQLKLREIDQATMVLVALKQTNSINFSRITEIKKQIVDYSNQLFASEPVSIGNVANYFSYSLIPQTEPGTTASLCSGTLSYKNSGAESDFSQTLKNSIMNGIGSESSFSLITEESGNCDYELSGYYQDSDNEIIILVNLIDKKSGNAVATRERTFSKLVLSLDGLRLLPANFDRIKDIPYINLVGNDGNGEDISIKTNNFIEQPITFNVELYDQKQIDLPVKLAFYKDGSLAFDATINSEKNGTAQYFLNKEKVPKSGEYELRAMLDIAGFLNLDSDSDFYRDMIRDYPPQVRKIQLKILSPTVFVNSSEMGLGKPLGIPILEPSVKNAFIELDYEFVDNETEADLILSIVAATRSAQQSGNFRTSYLDATISLLDKKSGNEIYKKSLSSIKGTAASFELGSIRAYEKARDNFLDDLIYELRFNNK